MLLAVNCSTSCSARKISEFRYATMISRATKKIARRARPHRKATAVIELAICLPVLVLLAFASLEGANMLFLRQATVQASYEAAKAAAKANGSQQLGETRATELLAARRVAASSITFTPNNVDELDKGVPFTVTIRVPGSARSITGIGPFNGSVIEAQATMSKE